MSKMSPQFVLQRRRHVTPSREPDHGGMPTTPLRAADGAVMGAAGEIRKT